MAGSIRALPLLMPESAVAPTETRLSSVLPEQESEFVRRPRKTPNIKRKAKPADRHTSLRGVLEEAIYSGGGGSVVSSGVDCFAFGSQ